MRGDLIAAGATVDAFDGLAELPMFGPEAQPTEAVRRWLTAIDEADAVAIAAPEYAGALAGGIKNALDWVVGSGELYRRPVGVITAGTTGGDEARRMLVQTLTWQGAHVVAAVGIAAPKTKVDDAGHFTDPATLADLEGLAATLTAAPAQSAAERLASVTAVLDVHGVGTEHLAPPLDPGAKP